MEPGASDIKFNIRGWGQQPCPYDRSSFRFFEIGIIAVYIENSDNYKMGEASHRTTMDAEI